ncbi:RsmB/NOP family class I SAM-dependent RNA methyltransferase [Peptostreptococcaceae bacterium AGR-M142]
MNLPNEFLEDMKKLFKSDYEDFFKTYSNDRYYGLRVNTLKIKKDDFLGISPFKLEKIMWSEDGYYYDEEEKPAKNPLYHAGLYYIQEPSAMFPVEVLDIKENHKVLDLCAAPGGKSVQIASKLKNTGLLVTNDINSTRLKPLIKNMELYGVINFIGVNDSPKRLLNNFPDFFDRILVDAPCSGEGMFRKDEKLIKSWLKTPVEDYKKLQLEILTEASKMLKNEGKIVYSTCTFNTLENEEVIKEFLKENKDFTLINIKKEHGITKGYGLDEVARLLPFNLKGEGHFLALLQKNTDAKQKEHKKVLKFDKKPQALIDFEEDNLNIKIDDRIKIIKDKVYLLPNELIEIKNLKVVRSGLLLGELKKNRFEPSQAFAMAFDKNIFKRVINLKMDSIEVIKYLKGETIFVEGQKGLNLVTVEGFNLGFGKLSNNTLKNKYDKNWRYN